MPVLYGPKSLRPAPYVTLAHGFNTLGDGRRVGSTITATLTGKITAQKTDDTENPLAIEQRLSKILSKQKEIRDTFSQNGLWFEIIGLNGSTEVKFIATVTGIEFQDGPWVDTCDYTVTLTGESPAGEGGEEQNHVESASESWQFEEGDGPHTYRVSHNLSAKGKTYYDTNAANNTKAWEYARIFVKNKLKLGWAEVNLDWSTKSGNDIFLTGNIENEGGMLPFNRVITETVDELEGNYNVTETFFLSKNNYWEEYTINIRRETGNPLVTNTVGVNGVIHGLTDKIHDPEGKTVNALARFADVETLIYSRLSAYVTGIALNPKYTTRNVDINTSEGTVSYQMEFDNRILINHTYEWFNVSLETSLEDNKTNVKIDGVITGVKYLDDIYDPQLPYNRAKTQFELVKLLMLARAKEESGVNDLKAFPVTASVTPDKQAGTISYSFSFDNRLPDNVRDEFNVTTRLSREDGRSVVNVSGSITGLRVANANFPFVSYDKLERYNNAKNYFGAIQDNIIGLSSQYIDVSKVNPIPYSKSVSHIPNAGQISYEYEFNSVPKPCVAGALSENIRVTDDAATPIIAIIPILGRRQGPIIQNIGTVKEKRRTLSIEIVMPTDMNTDMCSITTPNISVDIGKYAPTGTDVYLEQDQTQWSPSDGSYSRSVSWVYI